MKTQKSDNKIKVSVIMPCLNAVKYIRSCMDSVIGQSLSDMEILVVDAGSTDGTLEVLAEYADKEPKVRVIPSGRKSYGYQMNCGIANATGEYIGIVETDDMIQQDMYISLYAEAVRENADYVKGTSEGFYRVADNAEWRFPIVPCDNLSDRRVVIPCENPKLSLSDNFLWNGIYHREFMKTIRFNETDGAAFQDIGALFQILSRAKKGVYINRCVYHYRQDNGGASSYDKKSFSYVAAEYKYTEQFVSKLPLEWETAYYMKMAGHTIDRLRFMAGSGEYWRESEAGMWELRRSLKHAADMGRITEENCGHWQQLQMFIADPYRAFLTFRKEYLIRREQICHVLGTVKEHDVCIFGAGRLGRFLHVCCALSGINVIAYCDNKKSKETVQTLSVLTPEEAVSGRRGVYYVIAAVKHFQEMKEQLIQLGVEKQRIVLYHGETDIYLLKEIAGEYES